MKLFIFDLDNTLYLQHVSHEHRIQYEEKLRIFLQELIDNNKLLAIASHNSNPREILSYMQIDHYFDPNLIIGEYPRDKFNMIEELLQKTNCIASDCIFFDDYPENVYHCEINGIKSILVKSSLGIDFTECWF